MIHQAQAGHCRPQTSLPPDPGHQILAALSALAAAPGRLYPVAYLGPLADRAPLRRALATSPRLRRLRAAEVHGGDPPDADVVICGPAHARGVREAVRDRIGVQVLVVGETSPDQLRDDECDALGPGAILVDVRPDLAAAQSARVAEAVERVVRSEGEEPLVVLTAEDAFQETIEACELHLACAGLRVRRLDGGADVGAPPAAGEAWVVAVRQEHGTGWASAAAAAAACRAAGVPLLVISGPDAWDRVRENLTWRAAAPRCAVIRGGALETPAEPFPWPRLPDVLIGAVQPPSDVEPGMRIPAGTPLVAALGHLEISGRPGSLVVWGCDRVAVIRVVRRAAGAVVVDVRLGDDEARTRDEALRGLDEVRGWTGAEMAIVFHPDRGPGPMEETVTRVGFFLSRIDDERSAGLASPSTAAPRRTPGDVARTLIGHGLTDAATDVLRDCDRRYGRTARDTLLLGCLLADRAPADAVAELRDAAFRAATAPPPGGDALQLEATLNALLLLVRTRQIAPGDAWLSLQPWIDAAGVDWVSSAEHAAIAFELASRSGHDTEARLLAVLFERLAPPGHPLWPALRPHLHAALGGRRAA